MGPDVVGGVAQPEARLAGHLVQLLGDKDMSGLSVEVAPLVRAPGPGSPAGVLYTGVLRWLVGAIAEVVVARLGVPEEGESFEFRVRSTHGRRLGVDELPDSGGRVLRSVNALLADDRPAARAQLAAAAREPDPVVRAETLVAALVWVDALLDARTPAFPDPPPR
ncbi:MULTISPECIES: hypothetical protein [Rhodococcus]|uniref:hypothetical protein n=1 Tax=Rhodococcus TaxID=1827 RepID=UPI001359405A|nr:MULTISPECIES: hypothetical protein [Rhodococcus]KAF0957555.1 hypothetical protein MLGJGCBP_09387 [Rhodococcus sp. T7]KAF0963730.1 hypothetical protein MLGJGCBP_03126 [Rhodococcus sp. T7]QQZ18223.1 hypothetical protein GO592_38910 [Rhodococcus sp. 21391]UOT08152.1 hypothetical protein MPY17_38005 [Rhodococcus opacus]